MAYKKVFHYQDLFDQMHYPAGEPHVKLKADVVQELKNGWFRPFVLVEARNWNDLMAVRIGDEILKDNGILATFVIPYLPFSRHDRKNDELDSMPVRFVIEMLHGVHVITVDPHSDVAGMFPYYPQSEVVKLFEAEKIFNGNALVAIPDAGATKKAYTWLNGRGAVQCIKTRDPKTGKLSGFHVVNPETVMDRNVVIIDDICDGGGTFFGLADELEKLGARSLRLGVTHGLFTKGITELCQRFEGVFTLDCGSYGTDEQLITVSTEKLILEGKYF